MQFQSTRLVSFNLFHVCDSLVQICSSLLHMAIQEAQASSIYGSILLQVFGALPIHLVNEE